MNENEKNEEEIKLNKTLSYTPEIENIFQMIYQEKIEELSKFILNEKNEVWDIKRSDDLTLLHSACIFDKKNIVETIVNDTKKRLNLLSSDTLPLEEKTKNEKKFKDFINARTEKDSLTALHYASFRGNIKIIKLLIENKAEINAVSSH
jgi:ankyrin repeat protein